MKKIIVDERMYVVFDDSIWDALENFQGNNVTFIKKNNVENTSVPTLSVSRKKGVEKNVNTVYHYTFKELRRILDSYEDKVLERNSDSVWFGVLSDKWKL